MDNDSIATGQRMVTVAFADDHLSVRKGIIAYIEDLGGVAVIIEADNGKELIGKIQRGEKNPDVCMIDILMPQMNGFETVAAIRKRWPAMKILVLSTYTDDLYAIKMIRMGVNGYLSKTCSPEEIRDAIIAVHEKGHYYSDFFVEKTTIAYLYSSQKTQVLTEKEIHLLKLCCSDMTYLEIAQVMNTTPRSVDGYRDGLFRKLHVNSRIALALYAIRTGIVTIERPITDEDLFANY